MKSIVDLWNEHLLPIKNAVYFADGTAFSIDITLYPEPRFEKGDDFCFSDFFKNNEDEITDVDLFKKKSLSNKGWLCFGEGSYGSEGFIACLNSDDKLIWVLYSENSNPFVDMKEVEGVVYVKSSLNICLRIKINDPREIELCDIKI